MDRGPGFYKLDNTDLLHGPNYVLSGNYNLYAENKNEYIYPISGWYWFDAESAARVFFGLPELKINIEEGNPYA
jgi:hypothetical protein